MQVDMPEENENEVAVEEAEDQSYTVENPSLDLEACSNAYTGLAKLHRLQFIADHCPCYTVDALKLAIRWVFKWLVFCLLHSNVTVTATVRIRTTRRCTSGCTASWPTAWRARPTVTVAAGPGPGCQTWLWARQTRYHTVTLVIRFSGILLPGPWR